jgi:hypothetical protein
MNLLRHRISVSLLPLAALVLLALAGGASVKGW